MNIKQRLNTTSKEYAIEVLSQMIEQIKEDKVELSDCTDREVQKIVSEYSKEWCSKRNVIISYDVFFKE